LILAVGGGSVIDSAKAIAMGVNYMSDVWDFFEGNVVLEQAVPLGAVLTLSGSGSEASKYTVITNEENLQKKGFGSDLIRPEFAILNPELTYSVPKTHTASGVVDIISHALERYFGEARFPDINDRFIEVTIKTVMEHAMKIIHHPDDYHARSEIMWTSTIAQNDMMGLGRASDFEMHKIEHELSAFYDISHGAGLAIIIPAWMRYVYKKNTNKLKELFLYLFNLEVGGKAQEENILEGILKLEDFFKKIGMSVRLKELDISDERFDEIAARCVSSGPIGKIASLGYEDILSILDLAK
jgi:alcohol dehydrogenase